MTAIAMQGGQVVQTINGDRLVVVRVRRVFVIACGQDLQEREVLRADVVSVQAPSKEDRKVFGAYWERDRKAAATAAL